MGGTRSRLPLGQAICQHDDSPPPPYRVTAEWGKRRDVAFPADPVEPPDHIDPKVWPALRHDEPHTSAFWKVTLACGHVEEAIAPSLDRRPASGPPLMVITDLLSAAVLDSVPLASALGVLTPVHVLAAAFGVHTLFAFFDAANWGALPVLVGRDLLPSARAAVAGASNLAELAVPAATSAALAVFAPSSLITVDACSFLASALLIRGITRPMRAATAVRQQSAGTRRILARDVLEGLGYLWRQPLVRPQTAVWTAQCFSGGLFVSQVVPWANRTLSIPLDDARLGGVYVAWAAGGLLGTFACPRLSRRWGDRRLTLVLLPLSAAGALTITLANGWAVAYSLIAPWACVFVMVNLAAMTSRQKLTPDVLQSRVSTTGRMLSFGVGWPLGAAAGGGATSVAGPRGALVLGGVVLVVAAAAVWFSPLARIKDQAGADPGAASATAG